MMSDIMEILDISCPFRYKQSNYCSVRYLFFKCSSQALLIAFIKMK